MNEYTEREQTLLKKIWELEETIKKQNNEILALQKPLIPKWIEADFKGIEAQISELYHTMNLIVTRINMNQYKQPIDNITGSASLLTSEEERLDWEDEGRRA